MGFYIPYVIYSGTKINQMIHDSLSSRFILLFAILLNSVLLNAQDYFYAVYEGDTIELSVTGENGTIQWQEAEQETGAWTNIAGETANTYTLYSPSSGTGFRFYRAEITNVAVCAAPWYSEIIKHRIINSTQDVQVLDWYEGGLVFYTDGAGGGLISETGNQGEAEWGCEFTVIGAGGIVVGTGAANSASILANCLTTGTAADICNSLVLNGYDDWFLPSQDELGLMYTTLHDNGYGMTNNYFWSSTEVDDRLAVRIYSQGTGQLVNQYKSATHYVKAVRAFAPPAPPLIILESISDISTSSAMIFSNVIDEGTTAVTERGVCWSTATNPTINDSKIIDAIVGLGQFQTTVSGLTADTQYFIKSYAVNSIGITYSDENLFITLPYPVVDYDGNGYDTVYIGGQVWMQENLKVTHFADGTPIPNVTGDTPWKDLENDYIDKAYCWYNDDFSNKDVYGALYTFAAATNGDGSGSNVQGACPDGWHLPSDAEWKQLEMFLGMSAVDADATHDRGTNQGSQLAGKASLWPNGALKSDPEFGTSGFDAVPAGIRNHYYGYGQYIGSQATWWCSTPSSSYGYVRTVSSGVTTSYRIYYSMSGGHSVRCVMNP